MSGCPPGQWPSDQNCSPRRLAPAAGPSPRGVQCFTGSMPGAFFGARVTKQPQITNANRTARKMPSSRLSAMLFSALGRGASIRGAGTPFPLDRQRGHHCCGSQCRGTMGAIAVSPSLFGELTKGRCRSLGKTGLLRLACHRVGHFGPNPLARNDGLRTRLRLFELQ